MARILIADDEREILELYERALGKRGHEVETFADGAAAVEALEQGSYDLVITDLKMPGRTGFDVLAAARARRASVPVIVATGATAGDERARAEALGAYVVLHKPIDVKYLLTIVESAIDPSTPAAPLRGSGAASAQGERGTTPAAPSRGAGPFDSGRPPAGAGPASAQGERGTPAEAPSAERGAGEAPAALVRVMEAEPCLANLIAYCLRRLGWAAVAGGAEGAPAAVAIVGSPDQVPAARREAPRAVLIALHPERDVAGAVRALEAGADIVLGRPFEPDVLFAYVRAAMRRAGAGVPGVAPGPAGGHGDADARAHAHGQGHGQGHGNGNGGGARVARPARP